MKPSSAIKRVSSLGLIFAGFLTGCAAEPLRPELHLENGKQIRQQLDEGLWIDLQVDYPEGTIPKIYRSELPPMNETIVESFLTVIGDRSAEVLFDETIEGCRNFALNTENGAYLSFNRTVEDKNLPIYTLLYSTPLSFMYSLALRDNWPRRNSSTSNNTDLYRAEKEFAFGSCLEVQRQAEAVLQSIGIPDAVLTETLYLDHKTMTEYLRTPEGEEALNQAGAQALAQTGFDDSCNAYYFRFSLTMDGIYATENILETATSYIPPANLTVLSNASGVVTVYINAPWRFLDEAEAPNAITMPETVLQEVIDWEMDTLTMIPRTIDSLRLEYLTVQAGDHWIRMPVWIVTVRYDVPAEGFSGESAGEHRIYLFDAISGDRLS